jgi:preprotein translocase subunit SecE
VAESKDGAEDVPARSGRSSSARSSSRSATAVRGDDSGGGKRPATGDDSGGGKPPVKGPKGTSGRSDRPRGTRERNNPIARLIRFVREVVAELRKVIWPTRKELITYTSVVIVFVAIMVAIVWGLDAGFAKLVMWGFGGNTS